jgi:Spy/CpxP family protein refolding chaperone
MKSMLRSALMLALVMIPLAAQPRPGWGCRAERMGRVLNLTDAQKASIRTIRDKYRTDLVLRRDAVKHARIDLRTALQDPTTPEARLRALYDKAANARFDAILAQRALRLEVRAVLTPEQQARANELHTRFRGRMHERMGHRPLAPWMAG